MKKEYWMDVSTLDYAVYFYSYCPRRPDGTLLGPFTSRTAAKKEAAKIMRQYISEYKEMLRSILECKESDFQSEEN